MLYTVRPLCIMASAIVMKDPVETAYFYLGCDWLILNAVT